MTNRKETNEQYQIRKLKYEIRKRDQIIQNLIEHKGLLYSACKKLLFIMDDTPMEDRDHDAGKEGYNID